VARHLQVDQVLGVPQAKVVTGLPAQGFVTTYGRGYLRRRQIILKLWCGDSDESPRWGSNRPTSSGKVREDLWNELPPDLWLHIFHSAGFLGPSGRHAFLGIGIGIWFKGMVLTVAYTWSQAWRAEMSNWEIVQ
jgi:hypothetical protein